MTEINLRILQKRIEAHLDDECTSLDPFRQGSHHMTYISTTINHGPIFVRVQRSLFTENAIVSENTMHSEVATMRYVKKHTSIPIPVVLHHDPDSDKQVGGEWMIMEHINGRSVSDAWLELTGAEREQLCIAMADVWSELMTVKFTSIGSLHEDANNHFRIGPMAFFPSDSDSAIAPPDLANCGPFDCYEEWLDRLARGQLDYRMSTELSPKGSTAREAVIKELEQSKAILQAARNLPSSVFHLEHIDFSPHNILVDPNDLTKIIAVIDWEGSRAVPMWAMNPQFLWPSALDWQESSDAEHEPENRRLKALMRERISLRVPAWGSAIGDECRALRIIYDKARKSHFTALRNPEPYLRMSWDIEHCKRQTIAPSVGITHLPVLRSTWTMVTRGFQACTVRPFPS